MAKANITHDISIREVSTNESTALGFMLLANADRLRGHKVGSARTIQPRVLSMGELTESEAPVDIELLWFQENWQLGIGGINHRLDPKKIAFGLKVDTSDGTMKPASEWQSLSTNTCPTLQFPTGFASVGTEMWAFYERQAFKLNYTGPEQWQNAETPDNVAKAYRNGVEFEGKTYVPGWTSDNSATPLKYIFKADADCNWTVHPGSNAPNDFKYFSKGVNASGSPVLWGAFQGSTNNVIRNATDPSSDTTATWSSPVAIGSTDSEITALVQDGDTLLVCKTNGIWSYLQDGSSRNLTPEFENAVLPDNFRGAFNWNGHVLLPLGRGGMLELNEGRLFDISFDLYMPDDNVWSSFHNNRVLAITGDPTTLFVTLKTGLTTITLLMAKWVEFQRERDFRWHVVGERSTGASGPDIDYVSLFADGSIDPIGVTLTNHRIWCAAAPASNDVDTFFYTLDTNDHSHLFSNDTDAEMRTLVYDGNFPRVPKVYQTLDASFENLGAGGRTIDVKFRTSPTGVFAALGTLNATSGEQTLNFTDGTTGNTLELQFLPKESGCPDTIESRLFSFRVTSQLRPTKLNQLELKLYLADNQMMLNGGMEGLQLANLAQLRTWSDQAAEITVKDSEGTEKDMVMLPGTLVVEEIAHERGRRPEYSVTVTLVETG